MNTKIVIALLLIIFIGCNERNIDTKAEGGKLMQLSREWSNLASTDNVEKTLSYWADDAIVMSPGQPSLNGKKAIRAMVAGSKQIPGFKISWEPLTVSVSQSGDMAYMIERNQIIVHDSLGQPITEYNKSVTIWRKDANGLWKNVVDIWNADPSQKK